MRRRSFLKTLLASAMIAVGVATETIAKPEKPWTYEEGPPILNEGDRSEYLKLKDAYEQQMMEDLVKHYKIRVEEESWPMPTYGGVQLEYVSNLLESKA